MSTTGMDDPGLLVEHDMASLAQCDWLVSEGTRLRYATWPAKDGNPRGTIMLTHGLSEWLEKYLNVVARLREMGYAVAMLELRGHGKSGLVPASRKESYEVHDADLGQFLRKVVVPGMPGPIIGMGHSFGGCLTCCLVHDNPDCIAAGVLCSPMMGIRLLAEKPWLGRLGLALQAIRPGWMRSSAAGMSLQAFTSDELRFALNKQVFERHPGVRPSYDLLFWFASAVRRFKKMRSVGWYQSIATPMLVCVAGEENLVSNMDTERAAKAMPNAKLVTIGDAWHEILMEQHEIQEKFWESLDGFLAELKPVEKPAEKQTGILEDNL